MKIRWNLFLSGVIQRQVRLHVTTKIIVIIFNEGVKFGLDIKGGTKTEGV
jgi:hypothetical protein